MGAWGTKIFQSDDAADIRNAYREGIILGMSEEEAEKGVIQEFSVDGSFSLWLPLAVTQWSIGRLSDATKEKALCEIEAELSCLSELWKPEHVSKRREELFNARAQLTSQQPARKKLRMPSWAWKCPWPTGSVLQFRIRYPKEDNPYLDEYVLLQLLGASETPPNKIPCEVINVGLYLWHSKITPAEQMQEIEKNPPALSGFLTGAGTMCTSWCIMAHADITRENEIKCIRDTPFVPSGIAPIWHNAPGNVGFDETICRTLLSLG